ncbi:MAG: 7-carboxy-7-deazaguanine synthase QueE [Nitrosopumilus sp.]|nr:7-carboxy-7-deazaguanine synthase QueE [Nitrosopumilus sp.]MDA7942545.1 7-carboxy-7-deazaguanine synthase QueE [Nitrosopumilus sp.]
MKARITEVFTSVEGEGILCGTKTLFVRMAGCPFGCTYCDTPGSLPAGSGTEYGMDEAAGLISSSIEEGTYKVNFTGGDPLVQHEAVALLARGVQEGGTRTYLESSCFDQARFRHVLPHIDIAKIEFKTRDSGFAPPGRHDAMTAEAAGCLRAAVASGRTTYVKVVVGAGTSEDDVAGIADLVLTAAGRDLAGFVIQPVHGEGAPPMDLLMGLHGAVHSRYPGVRVIPQMHKMLGAP